MIVVYVIRKKKEEITVTSNIYFRVSERQIYIFKMDDLNNPLNTVGLDVSPAILMPYYDEDSSTLFLTGRVRFFFFFFLIKFLN